jgi:hypothetical protein
MSLPAGDCLTATSTHNWLDKTKSRYDRRAVDQSVVMLTPHLGPKTRFLLPSDCCSFVYVGRSLWQEEGSVVYNCCWASPAQSFPDHSPAGPRTIFYCLRFETPPTWRARSPYLYPPEQGGPALPPGTGFPFRRLLRLAKLRWRYLNLPPRGVSNPTRLGWCPSYVTSARTS